MARIISDSPAPRRRWYHPIELAKRLVIYAIVAYIVMCVYLALMQTRMIYAGFNDPLTTEAAIREAKSMGLVPWNHEAAGLQGYVQPDFAKAAPRGTIIVFHGNGGWAVDRMAYVDAFTRRGFRVFLYEYPGYGGRPGRPGEKVIVPDARQLARSLDKAGLGPIYVWGESLGAGVAAAVCADPALPVKGLVLLTPWDNLANVGASLYPFIPIRLLMIDKYDSVSNLQQFHHPICVVRSDHDEIVPPSLTLNLYSHLPDPKKLILHQGYGHNDWPSTPELTWWDDALDFIAPK